MPHLPPLVRDTPETRQLIREEIRALRDRLATLASHLDRIDHDAARDCNNARSDLFAAWSKLRAAPLTE